MQYGYRKVTARPFDEAVAAVKDALAREGFGVLTEIDVRETMKRKLGVERDPYVILGACNPQFAHRALEAEPDVGLLLPCNVIVYQAGEGEVVIAALRPTIALSVTQREELEPLAKEVEERLVRVVDAAV